MHPNAMQRLQVLEILYCAFESKPKSPWVNVKKIEELGDMGFALEVLLELNHAKKNRFNYKITVAGMLVYEATESE